MEKVIIIIGLPGSGKSMYSKTLSYEYEIYDDFIFNFFDGKVINSLKTNNKICLIDPRLCIINVFNKYIKKILKYVSKNDIKLILYENNINSCINNIKIRGNYNIVKDNLENFSNLYNINYYISYKHIIFTVYI